MLIFESNDELKIFLEENLLPINEARLLTKQSTPAFNQAVANGLIVPFYKTITESGKVINKLYLRSELELYRDNKRTPRG